MRLLNVDTRNVHNCVYSGVVRHAKKMNKIILSIFGLFISLDLISQDIITIDESTLCTQIENSIAHLKNDKKLKKFNFISERKTRYGGYETMTQWDYVEEKLGVTRDSIYYYIQDEKNKESLDKILNFVNNPTDTVTINISCKRLTFDQTTVNTIFSKIDNQTLLVNLTTEFHKPSRSHAGRIFLFFFNSDQSIKKVREYRWIE